MFIRKFKQVVRHCHTVSSAQRNVKERVKFKHSHYYLRLKYFLTEMLFRDEWKGVIGLEIHAQLSTKSKLFSSAPAVYGAPTNSAVALFDAAIPGTLPTLNMKAVELVVATGLAFGCKINPISFFDRKHYFYCDLPAGYQITQQRLPIAENGKVEFAIYQPGVHKKPYYKTSNIKQLQLEQDSGKILHENTEKQCFIDLNRAGIALVEIVFQPDLENEYEACALVKEVMSILERVGSCSCKMEEGALRVDANVSVKKAGNQLGVRTEIKNLASLNGICNAISYEINRQVDILRDGGSVKSETLAWDSDFNKTVPMRNKEEELDYRFMPEPNLPPLRLLVDEYSENVHKGAKSKNFIYNLRHLKDKVTVLPQADRIFLIEKYALSDEYAYNLVNLTKLFTYFKKIMEEKSSRDPKTVYLLLMIQLLSALNVNKVQLEDCTVPVTYLGDLVDLLQKRRINKVTAEYVLVCLTKTENKLSPIELIEQNNLYVISSPKELKKICLRVFEKEHSLVVAYRRKKKKHVFNELVSKIIEESKSRADTTVLLNVLSELLDEIDD